MTNPNIVLPTVDELVERFENGELRETYTDRVILAEPRTKFIFVNGYNTDPTIKNEDISITWFDDEAMDNYECEGFFPACASFEFTRLWYEIVSNYLDYYEAGDWSVEHGGLRWEYEGPPTLQADLHQKIETLWPLAYATYVEVSEKLIERGNVQASDRTAQYQK